MAGSGGLDFVMNTDAKLQRMALDDWSLATRQRRRRAFTLVELLVVIAIIGILVALLLPAIQAAREAARRTACQNNMKQLCLATLNYENAKRELPPSKYSEYLPNPAGGRNILVQHSTIPYILAYLEESGLADQWDFKQLWSHSDTAKPYDNRRLSVTAIPAIRCASVPDQRPDWPGATDYRVCDAINTVAGSALQELITAGQVQPRPNSKGRYVSMLFNEIKDDVSGPPAKLKHTTDGTSQTFMWFETGAAPLRYVEGRPNGTPCTPNPNNYLNPSGTCSVGWSWAHFENWYVIHSKCGTNLFNCSNNEEIYSFHVGGAFFGMGDGSVQFVQDSINPDIFISFMTRDSSDIITRE